MTEKMSWFSIEQHFEIQSDICILLLSWQYTNSRHRHIKPKKKKVSCRNLKPPMEARRQLALLASCGQRQNWAIIPRSVSLPPLLQPHDIHCGWSVSALASSRQDMHDVSEIECHARGPWMERGAKEERWRMKRDRAKEGGTQKSGGGGDRWIAGVRQKERQVWKEGIKCEGISAAR